MITREEMQEIENLKNEAAAIQAQNMQLKKDYGQISMFGGQQQADLVRWQLDLPEELERIEHLLRGDTLEYDGDGNIKWIKQKDPDLRPFNEHGIQTLMNVISHYLTKNTILSNYDERTINLKMLHFGHEINTMIYMKYEEMGMDTLSKKKLYPMIVREIVDTIHSAYLRALNGGERESLRTARHVSENISPHNPHNIPSVSSPSMTGKKFKWYNPLSW